MIVSSLVNDFSKFLTQHTHMLVNMCTYNLLLVSASVCVCVHTCTILLVYLFMRTFSPLFEYFFLLIIFRRNFY